MGLFDFFKKANENFEQGVKCLEGDNYPDAIKYFKQVNSSNKHYDEALIHILSSLSALGEDEQVIEWFAKLSPSVPNYDQAMVDVVGAYVNTGQYEEAFAWFAKISPSSSSFSIGIINYLAALLNVESPDKYRSECEKAIVSFTKLDAADRLYTMSLKYLLRVLSEYNKFQELLHYSNIFLEIKENHPLGLYFKGEALYELEKYDTALECLNKIYCESDEFVDAVYVKALIHEQFGNEDEAQKCWAEVERLENLGSSAIVADKDGKREIVNYRNRVPRKRLV
ncbi:hypothetical protein G7050_01775 [Dysgonomonas sp. HDW5A]|uniref:tetratricopeptide repeat protein n=1 Tax=Dysgonomonas sp. HDW5A TaxID=2714926 RepID=UPI0014096F3A|nr:hypothetical protein [Dysgonomonas sp. HDW5A]QIK58633.1 hypothetical protein G7050_01775 [Dysgonomonas sp. HDW5A]